MEQRSSHGSASSGLAPSDEIVALTVVRAPAAIAVVAFHFALESVPGTAWLLRRIVGSGFIAVGFFFVLSGFVLAHHYANQPFRQPAELRRFWVRRFARIYPLYLLSLVAGAAAGWPKSVDELTTFREIARVGLQLALFNAWHHVAMFKWNWAAWSLSVEAAFYFAFPWIFVALRKLSTRRLWQLTAACWMMTFIAPALYGALDPDGFGRPLEAHDNGLYAWYLKFFPVHHFPEFVAGVATGVLWTRRSPNFAADRSLGALAGTTAVLGIVVATVWVPDAYLHSGVLVPVFLALIVGLSAPGRFGAAMVWAPLIVLGRASYAIYILHVPIFLLMARFDRAMWSSPGHGLSLYAVTLVVASVAAHRWIEQPCRRLIVGLGARS
jgi:peptidoglycan/LPS O-acetylase OafA/YrhL